MKQAALDLSLSVNKTRKHEFLAQMDKVVPWAALVELIAPYYPDGKKGRPPFSLETMLRTHFLQQWFILSDPGMEEAFFATPLYREFAQLEEFARLPDESTILRFRHRLEKHKLAEQILATVNDILIQRGLLLKAMQMAGVGGKAELHIYGDATRPKDRAEWAAVLQALGPAPWLHQHGKFERDRAAWIYQELDVVVLPAIYLEVFGLVVAEALSAGRPVLSTRCGGPEDQIEDGVNGWLMPPNDPPALAAMIRRLADFPELVLAAASQAGASVKSHERYVDDVEAFS